VYVFRVNQDGPADLAGVQENDIITRIGEVALDQEHSFINVLYEYHPGDTVEIGLIREEQEITLEMTAGGS
jgi:S1-C subfamily serine protease